MTSQTLLAYKLNAVLSKYGFWNDSYEWNFLREMYYRKERHKERTEKQQKVLSKILLPYKVKPEVVSEEVLEEDEVWKP